MLKEVNSGIIQFYYFMNSHGLQTIQPSLYQIYKINIKYICYTQITLLLLIN